jgi:hypothetical protein
MLVNIYRLKPGYAVADLQLGPYGYADNAVDSYAAFRRLKERGVIDSTTRFQVTMPGPGTGASAIQLPGNQLLPLARAALWREMEQILQRIPADELTLQFDIGMEAEHEEYLRNPTAFDQPIHHIIDWTHAQMADSVAWLGNQVPAAVELGFHICSIWHHDPDGGQDNAVLVDTANAISSRIKRAIGYFHLPVIPKHDTPADYAPFGSLALHPETRLYLGLINLADGVGGAARRIELAETAVSGFGVGFWCGLGRGGSAGRAQAPVAEILRRPTPDTIGDVLDLHRAVAELGSVHEGAIA